MTPESFRNNSSEQQPKQFAERLPHSPESLIPKMEMRMTAHDLFTQFTATIILQKATFVR